MERGTNGGFLQDHLKLVENVSLEKVKVVQSHTFLQLGTS